MKKARPKMDRASFAKTCGSVLPRTAAALIDRLHVTCAQAFGGLFYFKLNFITVARIFSVHFTVVDENIFASIIGLDETKPFLGAEPLNFASLHKLLCCVVSPQVLIHLGLPNLP